MRSFSYVQADSAEEAVRVAASGQAMFLAGGTNLVNLMREGIEHPTAVVNVTGLSREIDELPGGGVLIGAAAKNTAVASHRAIRERFPVLALAILNGASAADPQHGNGRRKPASAHPLPILLRPRRAV